MDKDKNLTQEKNENADFFRQELRYHITPMEMNAGSMNPVVTIGNEKFDNIYNTEEGFNS